MKTLVDVLENRVARSPDTLLYRFLSDSGELEALSALELKHLSQALARKIYVGLTHSETNAPTILISTTDTKTFIVGFFACIYAGVTAIPAPALSSQRKSFRLAQIVEYAVPDAVLCDAAVVDDFNAFLKRHGCESSTIITTDVSGDDATDSSFGNLPLPALSEEQAAFIQYTSGTTQQPRGAVITHRNVVSNLFQLQDSNAYRETDSGLTWLPPYHDLGLTGCILHVLYAGADLTFISPFTFARDPLKWLQVISDYRISVSVGPTFAYAKCLQAMKKRGKLDIDLRCWAKAHVCAEPVQFGVLKEFSEVFSAYGFSSSSFVISYGMAEATLGVSAGVWNQKAQTFSGYSLISFVAEECYFNDEGAVEIVSCGKPVADVQVIIVDPNSLKPRANGEVGEIWLSGPNFTSSFYRNQAETEKHLRAKVRGVSEPDKSYVRSGDIGFMKEGELYVVGRLDQYFWYRDRYFDTSSLEKAMAGVDRALADDACIILPLRSNDDAELVIAQELRLGSHRNADTEKLEALIRSTIVRESNWSEVVVKLVKPLHLPRTTSGKIQRYLCRQMYFNDALDTVS